MSDQMEGAKVAKALGEFEQLILMALLHLGDDAYGVSIRREINERTGRTVAIGAVYTALARLLRHDYVSYRMGESTSKRGGRRKKYYKIEPPGVEALKRSYGVLFRMASGLEGNLDPVAMPAGQTERQ